jgi:hypothetical protein
MKAKAKKTDTDIVVSAAESRWNRRSLLKALKKPSKSSKQQLYLK